MYDNEEEIKRKRRNLLIIIGVVVGLILLLIIILIARSSHKSKPKNNDNLQISCELEVLGGVKPNAQNIYTQEIEIGFKSLVAISPDYPIEKKKIGTTDNSRNGETYKISKSGTYKLHGYIQDSAGNKNTCDLDVVVSLSKPSCELEVTKGTLGDNEWYKDDVEVGFKLMSSNSETASIVKYYIEQEKVDLDTHAAIRADAPENSTETYKVTSDQSTNLIGYVIDSNGTEGSCSITVKKDSTIPTCSLKVLSGTPDSKNIYQTAPVVGFDEVKEEISGIAGQGVGISKNYTEEKYTVEGNGTIKVTGYVKDKAGNEGTCEISINRPAKVTPTPTPTPKVSSPSCKLSANKQNNGSVVVSVTSATTTGNAKVTSYVVGTSRNSGTGSTITVSSAGSHTIYGTVKDSYGNVGYCQTSFTITARTTLASKVKVGSYVSYDAGTWNENPAPLNVNGNVGGFTKGTSRNTGVKCFENDTGTRNGWMVLSVSNGKVTLVHAGTPECIYFYRDNSAAVVQKMNTRANGYINSKYAESARILKCGDPGISCTESNKNTNINKNNLFETGTFNYLATNYKTSDEENIWYITNKGVLKKGSMRAYGIRPIVVLKSSVIVTGGTGSASDPFKIGV